MVYIRVALEFGGVAIDMVIGLNFAMKYWNNERNEVLLRTSIECVRNQIGRGLLSKPPVVVFHKNLSCPTVIARPLPPLTPRPDSEDSLMVDIVLYLDPNDCLGGPAVVDLR